MRLRLKAVLAGLGKSQSDLAREIGYSPATVAQLVNHGFWPKSLPQNEMKDRIRRALRAWAADEAVLDTIFEEWPEPRGNAARACPLTEAQKEDEQMLLQNESLTPEAREHFGLPRSPFVDDINCLEDVFVSSATRRQRAALMDCALNQGFMALVGESGSGKSTLREELEERIRKENRPVIIITPYVAEAEKGDRAGIYKPRQIAEAILNTLAPGDSIKQGAQARSRQVHEALRASRQAGLNNLLVIEEAHKLPKVTLRALKSYMELKDGLRRLLGVVLIGQTELDRLLSATAPDVREIVQRCERRVMPPLDDDLPAYLQHKFNRIGVQADQVFADGVYDAIRARLVAIPRGGSAADKFSVCHPLVVNNLVVRAINAAAAVAMPRVTADVIAGC
ncbi:AAA family ATPase [Thauera butanivorans]|uniref:AAA family ATPase n=1 Tax=Thauera butanivorans TaxID=86174 RepID=UPI003AB4D488